MFLKKYLQLVYAFWSKFYDNLVDARFKFDRAKVIQQLDIKNGEKILEIGVGTGLNLSYYPNYCKVYGVDFSKAMLDKAKEKRIQANVVLEEMDARNLEYPSNFFDKVLMTYVLRVSPQPICVLKETIRVLKPKGEIVIVDQFKIKKSNFSILTQLIRFLWGGGKDYLPEELVKNLPLKIIFKENIGIREDTYLYLLKKA